MNKALLLLIALQTTLLLCAGVVVFPGDSGVLSCPLGLVTPMFWSLVSDGNKQITSYIISPVVSVKVHEPWKSRGWNVDETNGDLVIPEVMLVDEGVYQCRNTTTSSLVILRVYVRPASITLNTTAMPVEINADIHGICAVKEIRPEPMDFYWMLDETRLDVFMVTTVVNSTYNVVSVYTAFRIVAVADNNGRKLTCVLVTQHGEELRNDLQIDVKGVSPPVEKKSKILVNVLPSLFVLVCLVCGVFVGILLVRKRKEFSKDDSNCTNIVANNDVAPRHDYEHLRRGPNNHISPASVPQEDNNDSQPGNMTITQVYENEGFDASQHELTREDNSATNTSITEPNNHDTNPISVPRGDSNNTEPGRITNVQVYGNEGFDAPEYEELKADDSATLYVTQPIHLQYDNLPLQQHVYESVG